MNLGRRRAVALTLLLCGCLSACGLKPEVKDQLAQSGGAVAQGGSGGVTTGGAGDLTTGGTTGAVTAATTGGTSGGTTGTTGTSFGGTSGTTGGTTGGTSGGTVGGTSGSTGGSSTGNAPVPGAGNTTCIDFKNKVIHIALHGPLTGAGVPQDSFKTGTPKYWETHKLANGFRVEAVAIDDKYNAQDALRACNAAAKDNFLIVGGAGTDQISACAQSPVLRRGGVPYLSSGVTEAGLGALSHYFATSLTYKQQAPLLIQVAKDNGYMGGKWAVVITGTPNFTDAREAIVSQLMSNGAQGSVGAFNKDKDVFLTDKAPNNCSTLGSQIRGGGYTSIYFLGQPAFFAQCVGVIGGSPTYTGPGPSFGINTVANLACSANPQYKAYYLHPSPSLNTAAQKAPGVTFKDDIEYGIYGAMESLKQAFDLVKGPLSRESFIAALAKSGTPGGIINPAIYNGGSRFGGTAAFANKAVCAPNNNHYETTKVYKK
jgi:branched-chain amino acid transport system substrate-binding protein